MSAPALTVRCGTCTNVINVPTSLLERLLEVKRFNCPHCRQGQQLNEEVVSAILRKQNGEEARAMLRYTGTNQGESSRRYMSQREDDEDEDEEDDEPASEEEENEPGEIFADYRPSKLHIGKPHPDAVVETASLAAVEPPDVSYSLHIQDLVEEGILSGLQLESIVYACQRHEQVMPGGSRCGFFIGDGAGVGKGRTIAGLILENWRCGRKRHLWISIGADLKVDARRDMDDVGAQDIEVHALNKLQYGRLDSSKIGVREGVVFLSYSSLISGCDNGATRIDQLTEWCGPHFDGLIVFDECHKAKNLVPDSGARPTKVGRLVLELQQKLPSARVVYCSATGASEPRNMGYMERLGLWGPGSAFPQFSDFLDVIGNRGVGALEMVAMDMKARGMYVCRTLSFAGAEFEIVEAELEEPVRSQYKVAARMWNQLRREFLYALEQAAPADEEAPKRGNTLWRFFWGSQQRFFRHMCMAAKVPCLVRMTKQALADGKCVVIGLQSTGEARTVDVVAERGEELDDFVSGPRELLLKLVEDYYPLPQNPDSRKQEGKAVNGRAAALRKKKKAAAAAAATAKSRKRPRPADGDSEPWEANGISTADSLAEVLALEEDGDGSDGQPGSSHAEMLGGTEAGRAKLRDMRSAYSSALKRKEQVKACMTGLDLPHNPLDMLIDMLGGPECVAEMTGRKGRLVRMRREEGAEDDGTKLGVKWEARNASGVGSGATLEMINVHERGLFLDGVKLVSVISEAASAGISLHADKRAKNQRRRVHLTLELPWSADKAIQQFGRSHRANQAHGPQYRLLFTPLGGERRFASSVAKRLESLGALTQGDRKAGPSLSAFNYESKWGQASLRRFYRVILGDEPTPCAVPACRRSASGQPAVFTESMFLGKARAQLLGVGIIRPTEDAIHVNLYMSQESGAPPGVGKIADPDKADVSRFLNRLLGLEPEWQTYLFDFFQAMLEYVIAEAKRDGKYEDGIVDVRATSVMLKAPPQIIREDPTTRAPTLLFTVVTDRGVSWEQACELLRNHRQSAAVGAIDLETPREVSNSGQFFRSVQRLPGTGRHAVVLGLPLGNGRQQSYSVVRPNTGRQLRPVPAATFTPRYQPVNNLVARQMWEEAYLESQRQHGTGNRLRELHMIAGLVLPIWPEIERCLQQQTKAALRRLNVVRLETTEPERRRLVGILLPLAGVEQLLHLLGDLRRPTLQNGSSDDVIDLDD